MNFNIIKSLSSFTAKAAEKTGSFFRGRCYDTASYTITATIGLITCSTIENSFASIAMISAAETIFETGKYFWQKRHIQQIQVNLNDSPNEPSRISSIIRLPNSTVLRNFAKNLPAFIEQNLSNFAIITAGTTLSAITLDKGTVWPVLSLTATALIIPTKNSLCSLVHSTQNVIEQVQYAVRETRPILEQARILSISCNEQLPALTENVNAAMLSFQGTVEQVQYAVREIRPILEQVRILSVSCNEQLPALTENVNIILHEAQEIIQAPVQAFSKKFIPSIFSFKEISGAFKEKQYAETAMRIFAFATPIILSIALTFALPPIAAIGLGLFSSILVAKIAKNHFSKRDTLENPDRENIHAV